MTNVVVIGDPFVSADNLAKAAEGLKLDPPINIQKFEWQAEQF